MSAKLLDVILNWLTDGPVRTAEWLYNQLSEDGWPLPEWHHWTEALEEAGFTVSENGVVTV